MDIEQARRDWEDTNRAYVQAAKTGDINAARVLRRIEEEQLMALSVMMEDEETMIVSTDELLKRAQAPEPVKVLLPVGRFPVKHHDLTVPEPGFKVVARVNNPPLFNPCSEIGLGEYRLATMPSGPRPATVVKPLVRVSSEEETTVSYGPNNWSIMVLLLAIMIAFVTTILSM